jgi:4-hydroxybutyrate dehydrogenase
MASVEMVMNPLGPLPRLIFGAGAVAKTTDELASLNVRRPFLLSDRGLERAGIVAAVAWAMPDATILYLDVPENPTAADTDAAFALYRDKACDGVVALGGGSVIDTAKFVAALADGTVTRAAELIGRPELLGEVAPLIAIPTTVGTGSESSPVSALHTEPGGPAIGTRSPRLVPRVAICDSDLARTLPRRLIAATGIDALSHCIEGYFAEPANPVFDALALDGIVRVFADIKAALEPEGDAARGSLMAAAFAGGAAIHKGLGPAHAVALACGDQDLHHGTLIGLALPWTVEIVAPHAQAKVDNIAAALGLDGGDKLADAIRRLNRELGLPATLSEIGFVAMSVDALVEIMVASPFNRTSPYAPTRDEYRGIAEALLV